MILQNVPLDTGLQMDVTVSITPGPKHFYTTSVDGNILREYRNRFAHGHQNVRIRLGNAILHYEKVADAETSGKRNLAYALQKITRPHGYHP